MIHNLRIPNLKSDWVKNGWVKSGLGQKWLGQKWTGSKMARSKMAGSKTARSKMAWVKNGHIPKFASRMRFFRFLYWNKKNDYNLQNICAILFCFSFDGHVKKHSKTLVLYILHKSNNIMPPPRIVMGPILGSARDRLGMGHF